MSTFLTTISLIIALGFAIETTTLEVDVEVCSNPPGSVPPPPPTE